MAEARTEQATFGWDSQAQVAEPELRTSSAAPAKPSELGRVKARGPRVAAKRSEPQLPPDNELWDVHAAARFLKRSASWVYHRAEDGTLPVRRLGGWGIRFIPGELRAWVESGAGRPRQG